ncbi:spermine/spermidine synthase [Brevibacillus humidisoli]|uniref:spermine/spermidine synthase domain-containing protein n=1 Tax=Brevibacillus humidisoli TaxID=2895522 RepID=UPI001E32853E|nr:spermine/spermidine synthase [Brevibacillus humidisoli]UFJ38971.1 spermine/spermidine synthase [Brevibacillus humidisoli]
MSDEAIIVERHETLRGDIQLQYRNAHYEIISNGTFLMATHNGESERFMVQASLEQAPHPEKILIGGLGVGFSLAEALHDPRVKEVVVVEVEDRIIEWNRSYLAPFSNHALSDHRTRVEHADLIEWMETTEETFDAICLDIDNGPDWTVTESNGTLYEEEGLHTLSRLVRPQGIAAFWSANASPAFVERMERHFKEVEAYEIPVQRGEPDIVYIGKA